MDTEGKKPKATRKREDIHARFVKRFDDYYGAIWPEREQSLQDRRFLHITGGQYEGQFGEQFADRFKPEVNKCLLSHTRINNEYKANPKTADFVGKDGEEGDRLASTCDQLHRADEHRSSAEDAYFNALDELSAGGYGAWRYRAVPEDPYDPENDKQVIDIEPINDADISVFFDPNSKKHDKSDAKWCCVVTSMSREAYEEKYDDNPSEWVNLQTNYFDWATPDLVNVCEAYEVIEEDEEILIFKGPTGEEKRYKQSDFEADEMLEAILLASGWTQTGTKTIKRRSVMKYILSGGSILEECGRVPGPNIPIVMGFGRRHVIDGVERASGDVRTTKDVMRIYNMLIGQLGEIAMRSPVEKPIFYGEEIAGHEHVWERSEEDNLQWLTRNAMKDPATGALINTQIEYTRPPQIPAALAALAQQVDADIKELLGNQERGEELTSNLSGKAVELVQRRLNQQSAVYLNGIARMHERGGQIWLGMAAELYVEEKRKMVGINADRRSSEIILSRPILSEDGEVEFENDLSQAPKKVYVTVGPSSANQREATVREIQSILQAVPNSDPKTLNILVLYALSNMEGENMGDIRKYARKELLRLGVGQPTKEEAAEMQEELAAMQGQPDPNAVFLESEARKNDELAQKARAETTYTLARTEETQAKTAETLAGIEQKDREQALNAAKELREAATAQPQTNVGEQRWRQ